MNPSGNDQERRDESTPQSGGLFGEEIEVKRENPYLRKNKVKNTSPPKPPKPKREKPVKESSAAEPDGEDDREGGRRRTFSDFIFEHVKLITAILTCLVILSLVFITDVTGWIEDIRLKQEQEDKIPLTMAHVRALNERGDPITWSDMSRYVRYNVTDADQSITWTFKVKDTDFEVWISGVDTAHDPVYVYLYDFETDTRMDLNKDNIDVFLQKLNNPTE